MNQNMEYTYTNWTYADNCTNDEQYNCTEYIFVDAGGGMDYYDISYRTSTMLHKPHILIVLILGCIATLANVITIIATSHVRTKWTGLFRFMTSLMMSDILVSISGILHVINRVFNPQYYAGEGPWQARVTSKCIAIVIKALNTTSLNISLLNLMGMAFDHFVAIIFPMKYFLVMNAQRTNMFILMLWVIAFVSGFSDFLSPLWKLDQYRGYMERDFNYCEYVWISRYTEEYTTFFIALVCLIAMLTIYLKIYCKIKEKHQKGVVMLDDMVTKRERQSWNSSQKRSCSTKSKDMKTLQKNDSSPLRKTSRSKRNTCALYTTLLILGSFMLCWLPTCCFQIAMLIITELQVAIPESHTSILVNIDHYLYVLLLLNTLCDPVIYAIRIPEVRHGYKRLFLRMSPFKVRSQNTMNSYTCPRHNSRQTGISI